ncbi:hypothetical protein B1L11_26175 [Microbispora sp. GKU 823]|nr:hypothetical protein B1L11_26175 [Microbispora sp. GKU 823]
MSADAVEIGLSGPERAPAAVSVTRAITDAPLATGATPAPLDAVRAPAGRPLSPSDSGALRYAVSVAGRGALRTPLNLWERGWNWALLGHLRDGGTHRGPVAEKHAATYAKLQENRARRACAVLKVAAWPWLTGAKVGKFPVAAGAWTVTVGEVVHMARPADPLLSPIFSALNGLLGDAVAAVVHLASPAALPAAGLLGLAAVGGSIRREHDRRRALLVVRDGADVREDGELSAIPIADCSTPQAAMEAVRRALALEKISVRPLSPRRRVGVGPCSCSCARGSPLTSSVPRPTSKPCSTSGKLAFW